QLDEKSVTVVEIGPSGLVHEPKILPLDASPIYEISILDARGELPGLCDKYPDHECALVKIRLRYTAGADNLEPVLRELERVFPRCYDRSLTESGELRAATMTELSAARPFESVVREYLNAELMDQPEADRDAIIDRAEAILRELAAEAA